METIWVLGDAVVDLLPDGEGKLLQCRRRTGQRRGRGSASGRQKRLYRPGGRRPLRAFYAKRLQMSRLIQNGCGWTRSIAPPRWWWISITTVNVPLPLWFARALIYSSTLPISRHSAPGSGCTSALSRSAPNPAVPRRFWRWPRSDRRGIRQL